MDAPVKGCSLDQQGLRDQRARSARVAPSVVRVERGDRELAIDFDASLDAGALEQMLAVERECCPFFSIRFDEEARRVSVGVAAPDQAPALDALALLLTGLHPFLLVYDWACGQVVTLAELPGPAAHAEAERAHAGDDSIEVAVVYGDSLETLRRDAVDRRRGRTPV